MALGAWPNLACVASTPKLGHGQRKILVVAHISD